MKIEDAVLQLKKGRKVTHPLVRGCCVGYFEGLFYTYGIAEISILLGEGWEYIDEI